MSKVEIILIRHGETEWNVIGRVQGQHDSALSAAGVAQAQAVARRLKDENFSHLYSSDLGRAMATARAIASLTQHEVIADPRLREHHLGCLEALTWEESGQRYPAIIAELDKRDYDYIVPDGESMNNMLARTLAFLEAIAERHPGGRVAAVTHGAVLSLLVRHILGISKENPRRYHILNTSIHEIAKENGAWWLIMLGDMRHARLGLDEVE